MKRPQGGSLRIEGLTKDYGGIRAINGISFEAKAGEFVSLLGPSGCGKTTTLRCIAGFEEPSAGSISLDDIALSDAKTGLFLPPNKRHFGMVFQSYAVWPHMTVLENVAYPLKVQGGRKRAEIHERVLATLEIVGLSGFENRNPSSMSGGQQQRVAVARAIVMEPRALLFDEPLSNLDAKLRERMRSELVEIHAALGIPAIYVTHDQAEAMSMSDQILVMSRGEIVQSGTPQDVYYRPRTAFVADFIGNCSLLDVNVVAAAGPGVATVSSSLGTFAARCADDIQPGERAKLVVRPHAVEIGEGEGSFPAKILHVHFLGEFTELILQANDNQIRAHCKSMEFCSGQTVQARLLQTELMVTR